MTTTEMTDAAGAAPAPPAAEKATLKYLTAIEEVYGQFRGPR